jgi:DNA replication protein DnaC
MKNTGTPPTTSDKLKALAKLLRLKSLEDYESIIEPDLPFEENLLRLFDAERERRLEGLYANRIKAAGFTDIESIHDFRFEPDIYPNLKQKEFSWLLSCEYVPRREGAVLMGSSGVGKTHLATAVGIEAIRKGLKVLFRRADRLITEMVEAKSEKRLTDLTDKIQNVDLFILDELGIQSYAAQEAGLLYRVINDRYKKKSTIITTNLKFSEWGAFIEDEKITKAIIDRIIEHSRILNMNGSESYRVKNALNKKKL